MATLRDIQKRIVSVKNTQQITKAMKMVAAAKLRKAEERVLQARPSSDKLQDILNNVCRLIEPPLPPLLVSRPVERIELIVVTSDRGLCGGFNNNVIREAERFLKNAEEKGQQVTLTTLGRKARDVFRKQKKNIRESYLSIDKEFDYFTAEKIAKEMITFYEQGETDEVSVIYNEFQSVISQKVVERKIVPIAIEETESSGDETMVEYLYEPGRDQIFAQLLPRQITVQVYRAVLESVAGEFGARMTAMDNATRNAGEMIDRLTLQFNRARQAAITTELIEIVSSKEAM